MTTTVELVPTTHTPSAWRLGLSRGRLETLQFFRQRDAFVFTFLLPVMFVVVFSTVFHGEVAPGSGVDFRQVFIPGMIASGLLSVSFQSMAIGIAMERDDGTLKRLAGTPMPRAAYFIGKVVVVALTAIGEIAILLTIGTVFYGLNLPTTAARWFTFAWVSVLGVVACTLLGIAYSSLARSGKTASAVVTPPVLLLQFISGVFFAFNNLPHWLQTFASFFPLKWMTQGMRSVFLPDSFTRYEMAGTWEHGRIALWLVVWSVIGAVLCLRTFRWRKQG